MAESDEDDSASESGQLVADVDASSNSSDCVMMVDIDENGSSAVPLPRGPVSLHEILGICERMTRQFCNVASSSCLIDHDAPGGLHGLCEDGYVSTSMCSGLGTFEVAGTNAMEDVAAYLGAQVGEIVHWSSLDDSSTCLELLKSHTGRTKTLHRFGDMMRLLPEADADAIMQVHADCMEMFRSSEIMFELGEGSSSELKAEEIRCGERQFGKICEILEKAEFNETCYCFNYLLFLIH